MIAETLFETALSNTGAQIDDVIEKCGLDSKRVHKSIRHGKLYSDDFINLINALGYEMYFENKDDNFLRRITNEAILNRDTSLKLYADKAGWSKKRLKANLAKGSMKADDLFEILHRNEYEIDITDRGTMESLNIECAVNETASGEKKLMSTIILRTAMKSKDIIQVRCAEQMGWTYQNISRKLRFNLFYVNEFLRMLDILEYNIFVKDARTGESLNKFMMVETSKEGLSESGRVFKKAAKSQDIPVNECARAIGMNEQVLRDKIKMGMLRADEFISLMDFTGMRMVVMNSETGEDLMDKIE